MANWQDTTLSSPVYALMREMADDEAPHLNELPESHPDVQALRARCMEALKAGRRAAGASKGVETRARNAAKGISQVGLRGTSRQKQWAAEIRGSLRKAAGDDASFAALADRVVAAAFWIDNRKADWRGLAARYAKLKAASDTAAVEARELMIAHASNIPLPISRRIDGLVAVQDNLSRFLKD